MRESRTYGSVRGARDETRIPTATGCDFTSIIHGCCPLNWSKTQSEDFRKVIHCPGSNQQDPYQDLTSSGSGTVSLTISHRSCWHTLLSALASACRKTIKLSGWYATTKSSPSRLIDTCLRKRAPFRNASTASSTDITTPHILTKPHQNYRTSGEAHWPAPRTDRCGGKRRDSRGATNCPPHHDVYRQIDH